MLKNDTQKNDMSRIGLYGSAPQGLSSSHFLVDFINFCTNYSRERGRVHSPALHPMAMAMLNKTETESVLFPLTSNFQFYFAI